MSILVIKYDGKTRLVDSHAFIVSSQRMLKDFGVDVTHEKIEEQIEKILTGKELDMAGILLKDYILVKDTKAERKSRR